MRLIVALSFVIPRTKTKTPTYTLMLINISSYMIIAVPKGPTYWSSVTLPIISSKDPLKPPLFLSFHVRMRDVHKHNDQHLFLYNYLGLYDPITTPN